MDTGKKISFGFSKISKKSIPITKPQEKPIDFVDCLEGQSIKLKNEPQVIEKEPLIIPLRDNKKDLLDRVNDMKAKQQQTHIDKMKVEDNRPDSELSVDELAAREIIREAKLRLSEKDSTNNKVFVVPMKADELPLEGEKESTLADYENVPVSDFGLAILRGMGWTEGSNIGKKQAKTATMKPPELRPKGLGLGASVVTNSEKPPTDADGQSLIIKKGAYAKIVTGSHKGLYCEVQGLDDEAGRVIVKTSLKGEILALNEFLLVPVTRDEYSRNSKVLNSAKFEEYKMEQRKIKTEVKAEVKAEEYDEGGKYNSENGTLNRSSSSSRDYKPTHSNMSVMKKEYSNDESDARESKKNTNKSKSTAKYSDDSSDSESEYERSRKHKRKDKRRHRDKSRSPYKTKYKSSRKSSKSKHKYKSSDSESDSDQRHRHQNRSDSHNNRHQRKHKQ